MKITYIDIKQIEFTPTIYTDLLYESVQRIFLSFPIKVEFRDGVYYCVDGHKRLSILSNLQETRKIPCIINNDIKSNGLWTSMNSH